MLPKVCKLAFPIFLLALCGCSASSAGGRSLAVNPGTMAFGQQLVNTVNQQTLTITNTGTGALQIKNITLDGSRGSRLISPPVGVILQPGRSLEVSVSLEPRVATSYYGTLEVISKTTSAKVLLKGTGTSSAVGVSISPTGATLQVGHSQQFNATVSNTSNTAVTWLVNGTVGGDSTLGTISSTGLYTAPSSVPSPSSVTVTAQSVADTSKSASATVNITATLAISVSVSPTSASLQIGHSQQFAATVSNTSNTAVTWLVNGTVGGDSTLGTISSTGLYTAPSSVPSPSSVTVTAQSVADTSKSASATVNISAPPVSVSISPTGATLQVGHSRQFTATVTNTSDTAVTWLMNGTVGGDSTLGTISSTGLYTAPSSVPSPSSVSVTAQSVADTSKSASATVNISAPPVSVSISPTGATLQVGHSQQFTATVSNTSNTAVTWLVNGTVGGDSTLGTISSTGLYTAPSSVPSPSSVSVTAQSVADTSKSASATVNISAPPVSVSISPTGATLQVGHSQQFTATVSNTSNTAVTWLVNGTVGGDSTLGTISSTGLYTAPSSVPSPSSVTVTAQSVADTSKSASATVNISAPPVSVSISPTGATLQVGHSRQFTATVTNTSDTAVTWLMNGTVGGDSTLGTISSTGLYTAPSSVPSPSSVSVTAQSVADTSKSASATVNISAPPVSVSISPTGATLQVGHSKQFTATVSNTSNTAVTWLVNGTVGGDSTLGTISSTGLYTAPSSVPSPSSVSVTAQSVADTSKSASATV